jgi:hypothetical protein
MDAFKIAIKLFVQSDTFAPDAFIPVFHRWIQNQLLPNHLLIDVADYAHVPDGPATALIADEANLSMDRGSGRLGLIYQRKRPLAGTQTFADGFKLVLNQTTTAASLLEKAPELPAPPKFLTSEMLIRVYDRLLAPNQPATYNQLEPQIQSVLSRLLGPTTLTPTSNPLSVFELHAKSPKAPPLAELLRS